MAAETTSKSSASTSSSPKVLIPMADYGHDPTETAIPFRIFSLAGFTVSFATENGKSPRCDEMMLSGITGALLGATKEAKKAYHAMIFPALYADADANKSGSADGDNSTIIVANKPLGGIARPYAWSSPDFSMDEYDMVFLPGGHEKGVRQIIESESLHKHLARYFARTAKNADGEKCVVAAICHGVQVLATTPTSSSSSSSPNNNKTQSILHASSTTALPSYMEQTIYHATRLFLGDYYKTYGAGSDSVETIVCKRLDDPDTQFKLPEGIWAKLMGGPWVVEDQERRYLSARYPPDAWELARRAVEMLVGERK